LANRAKADLREVDVLARLGGEEFALLLPGIAEKNAAIVAERVRGVLSEGPVHDEFGITASFGVTEVSTSDLGIDDALGRADAALYAAKHSGRDRVVSYTGLIAGADADA
jgi:diguanylate cyclase (GGDEF)-like protein